jgi:uncharacterized protein YndB with AHSA1/START domain/DNA-binding transcriptional ArsR family regulator
VPAGGRVPAVAPGRRLAELLRAAVPTADVVVTRLEDADLPAAGFDAAVAATSMHWVELPVGLPILHRALRPGGLLAVWRTVFGDDAAPRTAFREHVDRIVAVRPARQELGEAREWRPTVEELTEGGWFTHVDSKRWRWSVDLTAAQIRSLFGTFSNWVPSEVAAAAAAVEQGGGVVTEHYVSVLHVLTATRRVAETDPTRRGLLDALFAEDGQTLGALQSRVQMTRFGVMKHLGVLDDAGLITTRRRGREKLHYLNPVPLQRVHDRWVSKYAQPWAAGMSRLKAELEDESMDEVKRVSWADGTAPVAAGTAVFEIFIKTTPGRLWQAITDPQQRAKYSFGVQTVSEWTAGSPYAAQVPGVGDISSGINVEVDPPRLLVQTFQARWSDEVEALGATRVTWEIEQVGTSCRLTVIHDQLPAGASAELYGGWPMILSGLKTLLETGELLDTPGSLRYAGPR